MNIKNTFCGGLTVIALLSVANAFADTIIITGHADYRAGSGGEFNVRDNPADGSSLIGDPLSRGYVAAGGTLLGSANGTAMSPSGGLPMGFETFCIEFNEFISLPGTYTASISSYAQYGGVGGFIDHDANPSTPTRDYISVGTAYLYSRFAQGLLAGYTYANGGTRAADAVKLQKAIWYLEEEISFSDAGGVANGFLTAAILANGGTVLSARANNTVYNVGVLNLGGDFPNQKQDQLILNNMGFSVPDGGLTLMLMGFGLGGLALMRRKLA